MKIVLSRKGFDSASGGGPSPIIDGRPFSLPIPAGAGRPGVAYGDLGLAEQVHTASRGKLTAESLAHHDPMFTQGGTCLFGQCGAAQSHLENQGLGVGDLFIFFGLFREGKQKPHHRIFGWLRVKEIVRIADASHERVAPLQQAGHPHALAMHARNDAIYCGPGGVAQSASPQLRLTTDQGPPSVWRVPEWLERSGLSYHDRASRWHGGGILQSVARGQEFVADVGDDTAALAWAKRIVALMA